MIIRAFYTLAVKMAQMKAVLFDFDGVIIDSEWPIYQSWSNLFKREGQELKVEDYVKCIGSDFATWSPEAFLEELTGREFDWKSENEARQIYIEEQLEGVKPLEGIVKLLEFLKQHDISCAIVSSSSHNWVDGWLEKLNLMQYFTDVVCKGDAAKIKPAPDLYLEGCRRFNAEVNECVVLEDSYNGILAANAAGCISYAIPSRLTSVLEFDIADEKFNSINEAAEQIYSMVVI